MKILFLNCFVIVLVLCLQGVIGMFLCGGGGLFDVVIVFVMECVFKCRKLVVVVLVVNLFGGFLVQFSLIGVCICCLLQEYDVFVYVFVEDVVVLGGYWLVFSVDYIWVDESLVFGLIGVIVVGFGFFDLIGWYGIEWCVYMVGQLKFMLDLFCLEKFEDVEWLQCLFEFIYEVFKVQICVCCGNWLLQDRDLFIGEIWIGRQVVEFGLVDGIVYLVFKMCEFYGKDICFQSYGQKILLLCCFGLLVDEVVDSLQECVVFLCFGVGG